jgi:ATP-binding cassette subfamily B protein
MPIAPPAAEAGAAASSARALGVLRGLAPFLRPYRRQMVAALLLLCAGSALMLVVPLSLRDLIDHGFAGEAGIGAHFLVLFALAALYGAAVAARYYTVTWLGERVVSDLRSAVYRRMLEQSPEFFETTQTGEVLSRLTGDTTLVQAVVGSSVSMGLRSAFQFAGGLVMLAATSPRLFSVTVLLLALVVSPLVWVGRRVRGLSRLSQDRLADTSAVAGEVLNAMPTVQAYTQEPYEAQRYGVAVEDSFTAAIRRTRVRAAMSGGTIVGVFGAIVFVLWLGARAVVAGDLTAGQLASFVLYAAFAAGGAGVLAEVWGEVMRAAGAAGRLMELLAAPPAIRPPPVPAVLPALRQAQVSFVDVRFAYPSRPDASALDGISFEVAAGETVALVGASGAGKTTLFQLLLRFYDVGAGALRLNGVDLRDLDPRELRSRIGLVPQDPVIFSADARANIRYGRMDASDAEVAAAARAAAADEFIERLPQGYETFLGERGVRLSGGQRQRIAIARALLKDPPLLLLDEATSALDAASEALVQRGLEAAMRGRTTLIIAHRLSTVRRADRIVVLERGRIAEIGPPAELIDRGGLYAKLAQLQLAA